MRALGCLGMLGVLAFLSLEALVAWWLVGAGALGGGDVVLSLVGLSIAGYFLFVWRVRGMKEAVLNGTPGRAMAGAAGAILIMVPGFLTACGGIALQVPLVQRLLSGVMERLLQMQMRKQMEKMAGGRFGGMPGGFPGGMPGAGPGGGFPGGFPGMGPGAGFPGAKPGAGPAPFGQLRPDQRLDKGKGKIIDTTAERQDERKDES